MVIIFNAENNEKKISYISEHQGTQSELINILSQYNGIISFNFWNGRERILVFYN
jgi:hypothetical protein